MEKVKMSIQNIVDFFRDITFVQGFIASLFATIVVGIAVFLWRRRKRRSEASVNLSSTVIHTGPESPSQVANGSEITQDLVVDKSHPQSGGVHIERVEPGATVNIYPIDYQDGVSQAEKSEVRELFAKARAHYARGEFREAIKDFTQCFDLEEDSEKRGALNLQIGNCYYEQRKYLKAAESYAAGLRESRKAKDLQGEASNLASIANTYINRPASSGKARGDNVWKAVEYCRNALKVFDKDEYPIEYAATQNNLGNAYRDLPAATAEERAKNIRAAIECYGAALEIYKKDEYPVEYAGTQNNLGATYTNLPAATPKERAKNIKAAIECYLAALEIFKKDEYPVEYATTRNNLGNAYTYLPSATSEERAENVRNAIECYKAALEIRKKDEYPVDYATTQNNLGGTYMDLPATTAEERAENIKQAINCFQEALEIRKKDEYPQYYCSTAANLGLALATIDNPDACYWLKEAYALREYLEDQGKQLEEVIRQVCKEDK